MLNKRPIFIVGFARGGTNIILNLLRSHPEVCSPRGETDQVFRGKGRFPLIKEPLTVFLSKWWHYLPVLMWQRQDVFSTRSSKTRREFLPKTAEHIDRVLFHDKLKALGPNQNRYKTENVQYTLEEIKNSRLLGKNLNGLIFLTDRLDEMYPDATFLALVRNGFAVCEGHIRRGAHPARAARLYQEGCQRMIQDAQNMENYHVFRFEDIIHQPVESLRKIYASAGLEPVDKIRLETARVITPDGQHEHVHGVGKKELVWYDWDDFGRHFRADVNENQINQLDDKQKEIILEHAYEVLEYFSYI